MTAPRLHVGLLIVFLLAVSSIPACSGPATKPSMSGAEWADKFINNLDSPKDREVRVHLAENLKEISSENQGLEKVITFLRDNTGTEFFVNWTALQAAGVDRNTPVTVNLRNISFGKALSIILKEVGGGAANLDYCVNDGLITISTHDDLCGPKYRTTQLYDISDFLPHGLSAEQRAKKYMEIITAIYSTIANDSWSQVGGTGTLAQFDNYLVINQTYENHVAIARLLAQMRDAQMFHQTTPSRIYAPAPPQTQSSK